MDGETLMAVKAKKVKVKILKGTPRRKGEGRTLTTGLTKGYGLNTGKQNTSLAPVKLVRMPKNKLKNKRAAHGTKAKRKKNAY
tara:strand:- start:517 stop:765 length:249 start_codon:yes stop_codon:yes gene_type:complete